MERAERKFFPYNGIAVSQSSALGRKATVYLEGWGDNFLGKILAMQVLEPQFGPQHHHEKLDVLAYLGQLLASACAPHTHTLAGRGGVGWGRLVHHFPKEMTQVTALSSIPGGSDNAPLENI